MVKLNVIYTRTGDKGETGLGDGSRRPKSDARVQAMGDVDETNSAIGLALIAVSNASDAAELAIEPMLQRIQNDLFDLGADLCLPRRADEAPRAVLRVAPSQVKVLEKAIDALNVRLNPLRSFVLPGGTAAAAALHQARAVCRRAERAMVALAAIEGEEVADAALAYVNRLSDYLFVAARAANDFGRSDVLWAPGANQSERDEQATAMSEGVPSPTPSLRIGRRETPVFRRAMVGEEVETAIGVISGTSMDGIDVALIESDGEAQLKPGPSATFPYPRPVAERLREVVANLSEAQAPQLELERLVTDAHVAAVEAFLDRFSIGRERVALAGLHGQTILHRPRAGLTRQLCDGARAAAALGIDVVSDFRSADVAAGGEGAPLAPVYHAAMASGLERPLMILNWGGVGNVTYLGRGGEIIAFDTGPANALLDDFLIVRRGLAFDKDGALGQSGRVDAEALARLMSDPYFDRAAPKSLDRNHFSASAACVKRLTDADGAATLSAFTVESTAAALKHVPQAPARWLVGGGGRRNLNLMRRLGQRLNVPVEPVEAIGVDGDSVEAQCFAYLALRSRRGLPISFPATTGAPKPMTGGVFWPAAQ